MVDPQRIEINKYEATFYSSQMFDETVQSLFKNKRHNATLLIYRLNVGQQVV